MKTWLLINVFVLLFSLPVVAINRRTNHDMLAKMELAQSAVKPWRKHILGTWGGFGMINILFVGEFVERQYPIFGGMAEIHYSRFINRIFAFNIGAGVFFKGFKFADPEDTRGKEPDIVYDSDYNNDEDIKDEKIFRATVINCPIGVLFNFGYFRLGVDLVPSVIVRAKTIHTVDGKQNINVVEGEDWSILRHLNLSHRITIGGRIPFNSRIALLPGVLFEVELINEYKGEDSNILGEYGYSLMFICGLEFGLK
ncbi:MAG: hypothetical protein JXR76_00840 [Deltaproteobacteria bacterium]|nr:hypothetical protein [Deltaproteobacteria bacterium]